MLGPGLKKEKPLSSEFAFSLAAAFLESKFAVEKPVNRDFVFFSFTASNRPACILANPKARNRVFAGVPRWPLRYHPTTRLLGAFGPALDLAPRPLIWVGGAPRRSQVAFL